MTRQNTSRVEAGIVFSGKVYTGRSSPLTELRISRRSSVAMRSYRVPSGPALHSRRQAARGSRSVSGARRIASKFCCWRNTGGDDAPFFWSHAALSPTPMSIVAATAGRRIFRQICDRLRSLGGITDDDELRSGRSISLASLQIIEQSPHCARWRMMVSFGRGIELAGGGRP